MSTPTSFPSTDPLPPQRPLEQFCHIETDVFCAECGYNLHGQVVQRDERLGLMICRCPECGKYHPAGQGTAATSLWMSRLAAWLLLFWVLLVLTVGFISVMGFGGLQVFPGEVFTTGMFVDPLGNQLDQVTLPSGVPQWVVAGTTQPVDQGGVQYRRVLRGRIFPSSYEWYLFHGIWGLFSAGIGFVSGALLVTFLWHWPRGRYYWAALLPVLTAAFLAVTYWLDLSYKLMLGWVIRQFFLWGFIQAVFVLIGIRLGRPLVRLFLRMFVPPKPRQHFAFLWQIDGKTPPPATFQS